MKLYTIVGYVNEVRHDIYKTYTNLELAIKCTKIYESNNKFFNRIEEFKIIESELEGEYETVYRVLGYDGESKCFLGICESLDSAKEFIIEKHEELQQFGEDYPHYDVEAIEL